MWSARPAIHRAQPGGPAGHADANPTADGAECHGAPPHRRPACQAASHDLTRPPPLRLDTLAPAQAPPPPSAIHNPICPHRPSRSGIPHQKHRKSTGWGCRLRASGDMSGDHRRPEYVSPEKALQSADAVGRHWVFAMMLGGLSRKSGEENDVVRDATGLKSASHGFWGL